MSYTNPYSKGPIENPGPKMFKHTSLSAVACMSKRMMPLNNTIFP